MRRTKSPLHRAACRCLLMFMMIGTLLLLALTIHFDESQPNELLDKPSEFDALHRTTKTTHHGRWEETFLPVDGMRFEFAKSSSAASGDAAACAPLLLIRPSAARGGRSRGVDSPPGEVFSPVATLSLSTAECAMECFLRGSSKCAAFYMIFDPRETVEVLSTQQQDEMRRGSCELLVDTRPMCRVLIPALNTFPLPIAFLWRSDVTSSQLKKSSAVDTRDKSPSRIFSHVLQNRLLDNDLAASIASSVTFFVLSSPEYLADRMSAAWHTWLADARRVAVFVESRREEALDSNGSTTRNRRSSKELVDRFVALRRSAEPRSGSVEVYVELPEPSNARERHVNGAWKPLAILHFLILVMARRENDLGSSVSGSLLASSDWFVMVDDDTYIISHNLYVSLASRRRGGDEAVMIGERFMFASGGRKVDYAQGGAGIVLSRATLFHPQVHLIFSASPPRQAALLCTAADETATARFALVDPSSVREDGSVLWTTVPLGSPGCSKDQIILEAGTLWPAGDMRLAWIVKEINRRTQAVLNRSSAHEAPLLVSIEHDARYWHRSVQLALGRDRRNERSAFPISFHRARSKRQMHELHEAVMTGFRQQEEFWPEAPGLVLRWAALESAFHESFVADPELFLEDDGWV